MSKKDRGQFYTTSSSYILDGFTLPSHTKIIEPFAGAGDLITWIHQNGHHEEIEAYDIEPKSDGIQVRDTLLNPPCYDGKYVITNPPYLARNKSSHKEIFDKYHTNDLYKCFIKSLVNTGCLGGIIIIPAGFFFSYRENDFQLRHNFMSNYKIIGVHYFEEQVFDDTTTTVVAFQFEKSETILTDQSIPWVRFPSKEVMIFRVSSLCDWIIGGEIYGLDVSPEVRVSRFVLGRQLKPGEQQTFLLLNALDSGKANGRISLSYKKDYIYPAKETSRTYATLIISGMTLNEEAQEQLCIQFNEYLERKREEYWSLFLPQFRESKEYARKRIPFELAYRMIRHFLNKPIEK